MNCSRRVFWRLIYRLLTIKGWPNELNRRVEVESELWLIAAGKRPLPDREECRKWALKLGIPDRKDSK